MALILLHLTAIGSRAATEHGATSIVIDAATGAVLSQSNPDLVVYPASLTKMMTIYLLFDAIQKGSVKLEDRITISANANRQPPTKIGLGAGKTVTVEDALQAIITRSANDMAMAVGEELGGANENFAAMMTRKARAMGMTRTTFKNPSGLPDAGQVSTARDMATLARRLIQDFPGYYHYFSLNKATVAGRTVTGHNRLMARYPGMDGMKTGYINASGYNLVSSAARGGIRLIGVVFGGRSAPARDNHMAKLLDKAFAKYGVLDMPAGRKGEVTAATLNPPPRPKGKPAGETTVKVPPAVPTPDIPVAHPLSEAGIVAPSSSIAIPVPSTLPPLVVPAPAAPDAKGWAVQIGAYRDEAGAMAAASELLRQMADRLRGGTAHVAPVDSPVGKLYRAQITGLPQNVSESLCAELARKARNCLVLAPGQS